MPSERKLDVAAIKNLVVAGWTGRNVAALEAHIKELEAIGVKRPKTRADLLSQCACSLLTTAPRDRGDGRQVERRGRVRAVSRSTTACGSASAPTTPTARPRPSASRCRSSCAPSRSARRCGATTRSSRTGTSSMLRSFVPDGGKRRLYQEGPVTNMRSPEELIKLYTGGDKLAPGTAMFCGTFAVHGEHFIFRHVRHGAGRPGAGPQAHARLQDRRAVRLPRSARALTSRRHAARST